MKTITAYVILSLQNYKNFAHTFNTMVTCLPQRNRMPFEKSFNYIIIK